MSWSNAQEEKKSLRARLSAQRNSRLLDGNTTLLAKQFSTQIVQLASQLDAKVVAAYLPFGAEPNFLPYIEAALLSGTRLLMPVSQKDGTLTWVSYKGQSAPGIFGFNEPLGEPAELTDAELILIPASAVDSHGNRLGKGKGFYDIALAEKLVTAPIAAVVFESEILESIPVETHDKPVNYAVTELRVVSFG